MQAFTTSSSKDPLILAASAILFNEDLTSVQDRVSKLKVGDVTNFGTVKALGANFVEFKARDTGVTKISFNQRKMGSKEYVLDKLIKITKEDTDLQEATLPKELLDYASEHDIDLKVVDIIYKGMNSIFNDIKVPKSEQIRGVKDALESYKKINGRMKN
jgi:hypothetical protein